jgi:hypothetical protein
VESHSAIDRSHGASCVRFDAKVEQQGAYLAPPDVLMNPNFFNNLICAHPRSASAKSGLGWISLVEVYRQGDQSAAATLNREVEPFLQFRICRPKNRPLSNPPRDVLGSPHDKRVRYAQSF